MKLYKSNHSVYRTQYHVVWCSKYRRKILTAGITQYLKIVLKESSKFIPGILFYEIGIDKDHVHIHMVIPPKYSVSDTVGRIKRTTSKKLRDKFPEFINKVYWGTGSVWSKGYFVSTVGIDEDIIQNYVRHQGKEDSGQQELLL